MFLHKAVYQNKMTINMQLADYTLQGFTKFQ
jgi:hypothetical protein